MYHQKLRRESRILGSLSESVAYISSKCTYRKSSFEPKEECEHGMDDVKTPLFSCKRRSMQRISLDLFTGSNFDTNFDLC